VKIIKTFNSNVVLIRTQDNREEIVMGKGIGFSKKIGDEVPSDAIEKRFVFQEQKTVNDLELLLERIDYRDIELASDVIALFEQKMNQKVSESSLLALADHIGFAITRVKENLFFRSPLEWELKHIFKEYYDVALEAVELLREKSGVPIPEEEAAFIAIHFVNSLETDMKGMEETILVSKVMQNIINIIKYHYGREFDEQSVYFIRFVTHIRYFVKRQLTDESNSQESTSLLGVIQLQYKKDYDCALKIKQFLEETYNWKISDNEVLYLTLHLNRLIS
jgi:beta-glucoside operon transcriptional antiterminator